MDLIDRDAAIKAIEEIRESIEIVDDTVKAKYKKELLRRCDILREAVKEYPQTIICKDCHYYEISKMG